MPRGGKRPGAGRKKGESAKTKAKRKSAADAVEKAAAEGITPLEVMLDAMRRLHRVKKWAQAASIARDCAPYVHPRLSAVTHQGNKDNPVRLIEEIVIVDGDTQTPAAAAPGAGGVLPQ